MDNTAEIQSLKKRLQELSLKQEDLSEEISFLKSQILALEKRQSADTTAQASTPTQAQSVEATPEKKSLPIKPVASNSKTHPPKKTAAQSRKSKNALEQYVGENLLNKIGILVLLIGIAIGIKYSIDHNLISPIMRIVLGYLSAIGLIALSYRLRRAYESYSAVLASGGIAILYFTTYFAYSEYALLSREWAFGLMVIFTSYAIKVAEEYDLEIIAIIGLVGAYGIPFLLGDSSSSLIIHLSYMLIINLGILMISIRRYWKWLLFAAVGLSWLIVGLDMTGKLHDLKDLPQDMFFCTAFFLLFYAAILVYKTRHAEKFDFLDSVIILANSLLYFGIGEYVVSMSTMAHEHRVIFTFANALMHLTVTYIVIRRELRQPLLLYLVSGLGILFTLIGVFMYFEMQWVIILYSLLALLLFWIGRTQRIAFYQVVGFNLLFFAFFNLVFTKWMHISDALLDAETTGFTPFLNGTFLSALVLLVSAVSLYSLLRDPRYRNPEVLGISQLHWMGVILPSLILIVSYFMFYHDIQLYWNYHYELSRQVIRTDRVPYTIYDEVLKIKKHIWLLNYSMLYVSTLSFLSMRYIRTESWGNINFILNLVALLAFMTLGLWDLGVLRDNYIYQTQAEYYDRSIGMLGLRYISYLFVALTLYATYRYSREPYMSSQYRRAFTYTLMISILWILTAELIGILDFAGSQSSYKLAVSILWAVYAMVIILIGIRRNQQDIRIAGLVLFGVILIKVFFYDLNHLDTLSKTIIFISIGILLLVASYFYNRYTKRLFSDKNDQV